MKQIFLILLVFLCLASAYILGQMHGAKNQLIDLQEISFTLHNQQANYKLAALKNIRQGNISDATGILEASLMVDESEMANCGNQNSNCALPAKIAYQDYMAKKLKYEKSYKH